MIQTFDFDISAWRLQISSWDIVINTFISESVSVTNFYRRSCSSPNNPVEMSKQIFSFIFCSPLRSFGYILADFLHVQMFDQNQFLYV